MTRRRIVSLAVGLGLLVLAQTGVADAAEIKVLCSNGIKAVVEELVPEFERATRHKLVVTYGLAAGLKRQIDAGEPFDVAILTPQAIDDAIKSGKIAAASRTPIARVGLAIAIRSGAPQDRHRHHGRLQTRAAQCQVNRLRQGRRQRCGVHRPDSTARDRRGAQVEEQGDGDRRRSERVGRPRRVGIRRASRSARSCRSRVWK